jgi:hypothetical protein
MREFSLRHDPSTHQTVPIGAVARRENKVMGEIRETGAPVAEAASRIEVRVDSLGDFVAFVSRELESTLEPATQGIRDDQPSGHHWGATVVSRLVNGTRLRYLDAHAEAVRNMGRYLAAGAVMMNVIDQLMRTYRTSEYMASLTSEQVLAMLRDAPRPPIAQDLRLRPLVE